MRGGRQPPSRAPSSYATEMIHLEHFERFLGEKASLPLEEVGCRVFDGYKAHRAKTVRTDTVNKELQTLRQAFALGVRYRYVDHNPLDDVERFERAEPERRFLTGEEIEDVTRDNDGLTEEQLKELRRFRYLDTQEIGRLLDLEAGSRLYPALTIVAYTGIRRGELLQLEWADVDLKRGKLWIKSRKGSRSIRYQVREIDIHPRVREALAEQREQQNGGRYVLADRGSEPWKPSRADRALRRMVKGTEFEGIGFHTLRHSFSSNLARAGVDDRTIDYLMGHQTEAMRRRYQHLFPDARRGAVERLQY